jgi:DNA-binding transcriptional MerR regulator
MGIQKNGYTTALVSRVSGASPRQLQKWFEGGILVPSIDPGIRKQGSPRRLYSFTDIIAAKVIYQIRQVPINLQKLKQIRDLLASYGHSFVDTRLIILNEDVYLVDKEQLVSLIAAPGQMAMYNLVITLDISTIEQEVQAALKVA